MMKTNVKSYDKIGYLIKIKHNQFCILPLPCVLQVMQLLQVIGQAQYSVNQAPSVTRPPMWWFCPIWFSLPSRKVLGMEGDKERMSALKMAEQLDRAKLHLCQVFQVNIRDSHERLCSITQPCTVQSTVNQSAFFVVFIFYLFVHMWGLLAFQSNSQMVVTVLNIKYALYLHYKLFQQIMSNK